MEEIGRTDERKTIQTVFQTPELARSRKVQEQQKQTVTTETYHFYLSYSDGLNVFFKD